MKCILTTFTIFLVNLTTFGQVGNLIWQDNFNDGQLDLTKWTYETGTGVNGDWGTGQIDRATDRIENVSFQNNVPGADDGCLVITTRSEFYIDRNYTSGRINSAGKQSWGPGHRIVIKAFPRDVKQKGQGFAFWMMPDEIPNGENHLMWPQGGEIDIMEYVGTIPYHNLGGVHYAWSWQNNEWHSWNHGHLAGYYSYENQEVPNPAEPGYGNYPPPTGDPNAGSSGFHTYGIDWFTDRMEFFIDDHVYHIHYFNDGDAFQVDGQDQAAIVTINNKRVKTSEYSNHFEEWHPFEHNMYAILSAGVGGSQNTYGGAVVPEAEFPCSVFIDWIKVYELDATLGIEENAKDINFSVFPNPTNDILKFQFNTPDNYSIIITDLSGKTVLTVPFSQSSEINISKLTKGTYIVYINNGKVTSSKKIILK